MILAKKDIADIVLVGMALSFIPALAAGFAVAGSTACVPGKANLAVVGFELLHPLVLLALVGLILFRRSLVLDRLFPNSREREVSIPDGMAALASYAFWIRLAGIFLALTSLARALGVLFVALANRQELQEISWSSFDIKLMQSAELTVTALLGVAIVWKADWIAKVVRRIGSSVQQSKPRLDSPSDAHPLSDHK